MPQLIHAGVICSQQSEAVPEDGLLSTEIFDHVGSLPFNLTDVTALPPKISKVRSMSCQSGYATQVKIKRKLFQKLLTQEYSESKSTLTGVLWKLWQVETTAEAQELWTSLSCNPVEKYRTYRTL